MNLALILICGALASSIVCIFVLVTILDWAEATLGERLAMGVIAGGLIWAAPGRLGAGGVGLGDVIFLAGVLALIVITYTRRILEHADELDGRADGKVGPIGVGWGRPRTGDPLE
ncbi:hypothetical protein [Phenylobacterium sp.]|uniref:hypothetical protein n=1 Tax=Phenylobacterium sp. TaxID=1871053 RepID=UPI0027305B72|nr:hypothetical protein [Phenylobacterium sp.]MDP2214991.1 hypothetical protein [Phenylobacterium sp.]